MEWFIKRMEALDAHTLYDIIALRINVFIIEQKCLYEELDHKDFKATHVFSLGSNGKIAAYLRVLDPGVSYDEVSIGRVLVHPEERGTGLGRELMLTGIEVARERFGKDCVIRISAQAYLERFYQSLGFITLSEVYFEDDIPHIEMILKP